MINLAIRLYRICYRFIPPVIVDTILSAIVIFKGSILKVDGVLINLQSPAIPMRVKCNILRGSHERQERKLVGKYLPTGFAGNVLEVGSGTGLVSSIIGTRIGSSSQHLIIEPMPIFAELTANNLKLNNCHANLIPKAISYGTEKVHFNINEQNLSASSTVLGIQKEFRGQSLAVQSASLGSILRDEQFSFELAVIDAEGIEYDIFANDSHTFDSCNTIIIETHPAVLGDIKHALVINTILSLGFRYLEHESNVFVFRRGT